MDFEDLGVGIYGALTIALVNSCALLINCVREVDYSKVIVISTFGVVYYTVDCKLGVYCLTVSCGGVLLGVAHRVVHHPGKQG
jgi:hypothetical protein